MVTLVATVTVVFMVTAVAKNTLVAMVTAQAFYVKFYQPEKENFPKEVETTDKLSRALVVRILS